ncbi:SIR2 family protein [Paenibacillus humicus]|uniref:SIR2 family protein n=1 Tax=Paenibacillus humicus TaxID=412861 RepID=UPI000FDC2B9C|nr:SIR2 family protein [Paenibacillus humicus]
MEYLKQQFHDFLNEDGEVSIAGYTFYRDVILRDLDSDGYQEAFNEWLQKKHEENLTNANEILSRFDNSGRYRKLQEIYRRSAIIPFVGAGLSMPSGYSSWTAFLYRVLNETRIPPAEFDELIKSGSYEEAAQILSDNLPNGSFLEQIENEFGTKREIVGSVQRLPYLFKNAVITTNFDSVISKCYSYANLNFDKELLGADAKYLSRELGENKRVLVKLHGEADSSRNRIFTKSEYDHHYSNQSILEDVIEVISNKTLLFLGCSLSVDRTIQALTNIVQRKGSENVPRHYAFLQLQDEEERLARRDVLNAANIYPIWYTDDHNKCIEALLEKLAEGVS